VPTENEAARARSVRATLDRAKGIADAGLPANVVAWLLHPDHASRTDIDPVSWSGGAFTTVPIERLVDKAKRAAEAPDDLETQITLLATEDDARRLGLDGLISAWSKECLRYQGVGWTRRSRILPIGSRASDA
jgi:hypothetical protein